MSYMNRRRWKKVAAGFGITAAASLAVSPSTPESAELSPAQIELTGNSSSNQSSNSSSNSST
jgi:hypothetical protein